MFVCDVRVFFSLFVSSLLLQYFFPHSVFSIHGGGDCRLYNLPAIVSLTQQLVCVCVCAQCVF